VNPETRNWLASAEYDLETAQQLLRMGRYVYVVFLCHLALEKTLKALVFEVTGAQPPFTHDLQRLGAIAGIAFDPADEEFVAALTDASVTTRYPDNQAELVAQSSEPVAQSHLRRTEEIIKWLRADPRLSQS
jgi:HEPN domain-containing protein